MDSFITDLSSQGDHDSRGVFTLDVAKAQLKLAEYQLSSFADFPKFILAAAVASGASRLVIWKEAKAFPRKERTLFRFENWLITPQDLHAMGFLSLDQNVPKAIRYLATALSTLGSRHKSIFNSGAEQCDVCLQIEEQAISERDPEKAVFAPGCTTLEVRADLIEEVSKRLSRLSMWSIVPVELEGKLLSQGVDTGRDLKHAIGLYGHPGGVKVLMSKTHEKITQIEQGSEFPQLLAFTSLTEASKMGFHAIVDGLPYSLRHWFNFPGICGFVVADNLNRDLSYSKLVQNQELANLIAQLRNSVLRLLQITIESKPDLGSNQELTIYRILNQLSDTLDVSPVSALLAQNSEAMAPCCFESDLKILKLRLEHSLPEERDELFRAYEQIISKLWLEGDIALALQYLNTELSCRKSISQSAPDRDILRFLLRAAKMTVDKKFEQESEAGRYLMALKEWSLAGEGFPKPSEFTETHPSWFLPFLLKQAEEESDWSILDQYVGEAIPEGLEFWRLILEGQAEEAHAFLKTASTLEYKKNRRLWYAFFWTHCKGMLDWAALVRLRMKLSRASLLEGLGDNRETWSRLLEALGMQVTKLSPGEFRREAFEMIRHCFGASDFWPRFLSLLCHGRDFLGPKEVRGLWTALTSQHMIDLMVFDPGTAPLSQPLRFGSRRTSNDLSP